MAAAWARKSRRVFRGITGGMTRSRGWAIGGWAIDWLKVSECSARGLSESSGSEWWGGVMTRKKGAPSNNRKLPLERLSRNRAGYAAARRAATASQSTTFQKAET